MPTPTTPVRPSAETLISVLARLNGLWVNGWFYDKELQTQVSCPREDTPREAVVIPAHPGIHAAITWGELLDSEVTPAHLTLGKDGDMLRLADGRSVQFRVSSVVLLTPPPSRVATLKFCELCVADLNDGKATLRGDTLAAFEQLLASAGISGTTLH